MPSSSNGMFSFLQMTIKQFPKQGTKCPREETNDVMVNELFECVRLAVCGFKHIAFKVETASEALFN